MSAAAKNNPAMVDLEIAQNFSRQRWIDIYVFGIVFDASCVMDARSGNSERHPSIDVLRLWHTNQVEKPECRPDEKAEPMKPSFRSWRQSRVCQRDWNSAR